MIPGNITTTAIITKGLFCAPVTSNGIITTFFSLYVAEVRPDIGAGGPYPSTNAWNVIPDIKNFYKPVSDEEWQYKRLQDVNLRKTKRVVMMIKIGDKEHTREFLVRDKVAGAIAKIGNVIETTKSKVSLTVSNVNAYVKRLQVKINRIRVFKSKE